MLLFITLILALLFVYLFQYVVYKKYAYTNITYRVTLQTNEVFEGDEIYIYEEITNNKWLPIPFVKVDTELPEGLTFQIAEEDPSTGKFRMTHPRVIQSLFVLRSFEMIRRRWRVQCDTRGTYTLGKVTMLVNDILGTNNQAKIFEPEAGKENRIVVLPKAIWLEKEFTSSIYNSGDIIVQRSLISDPLYRAGVREYSPGDPMNRINWLKTAANNTLMVNIEEFTQRYAFNIIMNMQSRDMEKNIPGKPTAPAFVEMCITVVSSVLDRVSSDMIPIRVISNTPPDGFGENVNACIEETDEIGKNIFVSPPFQGRSDMISALRMLAQMELMISVPIEKMLDHIAANPYTYTSGGNILFVSSFINERMINFFYAMRKEGIQVVFYITGTHNNAVIIPEDVEVHYKIYRNDVQ